MDKQPRIGILGGMGTAAGLYFQQLFFNICNQRGISGDQNYPEWIYLNAAQTPDRTGAINNNGPSPVNSLIDSMRKLQAAGADFVIVTCNTAHYFYEQIISEVPLPWIHLPRVTTSDIHNKGITQIGILATEGTLASGLYQSALRQKAIKIVEPAIGSPLQAKVTASIYDPEFGIKYSGSTVSDRVQQLIHEAIDELNTPAVLLGCTELSVAAAFMKFSVEIVDPLRVAAELTLDIWQGKQAIPQL